MYEGEYLNYKPHGRGKMIYKADYDYKSYDGFWHAGEWDGVGILVNREDETRITTFKSGLKHGCCVSNYPTGKQSV
jgi:hypothetical protein